MKIVMQKAKLSYETIKNITFQPQDFPPLIDFLFLTFHESGATFLTPILNLSLVKHHLQ